MFADILRVGFFFHYTMLAFFDIVAGITTNVGTDAHFICWLELYRHSSNATFFLPLSLESSLPSSSAASYAHESNGEPSENDIN